MWRCKNGSIIAISSALGSRFCGGFQGRTGAAYIGASPLRPNPMAASILSSNAPVRPANISPARSSSRSGASAMIMTGAPATPLEKTRLRATGLSAHPSNAAMAARNPARSWAAFAASRAALIWSTSAAGGATGGGVDASVDGAWTGLGAVLTSFNA